MACAPPSGRVSGAPAARAAPPNPRTTPHRLGPSRTARGLQRRPPEHAFGDPHRCRPLDSAGVRITAANNARQDSNISRRTHDTVRRGTRCSGGRWCRWRPAMGQSKTIRSEMRTETGIVEAIETASRTVTLKKADGTYVTIVAGPDIKRFEEVKVGDKVTARYYENVVVRVKQPGEADVTAAQGDDRFRPGDARRHQGQAADDHGHDHGHRPEHADDHLHRAERLELHLQGAGHRGARQDEGRRQGRHRLDRSDAGVARARQSRAARRMARGDRPRSPGRSASHVGDGTRGGSRWNP